MALACPAAVVAQPCNQGLPTGDLTGTLNTYYPGAGTAAAGATTITVDTSAIRGASATPDIVAGDMLLVIQMQDAEFNQVNSVDYGDGAGGLAGAGSTALNNTGLYEYVEAEGMAGAVITIRGANIQPGPVYGLLNSYTTAPRDDQGQTRRGQRTFQVVRVARRASGTLTPGLTVVPWDGRTGGILAVDVAGDLALGSATVSVDGMGFRGGVGISQTGDGGLADTDYMSLDSDTGHGRKGEGIACTPDPLSQVPMGSQPGNDGCPRGDRARGAPGNAGGGGTDGNPVVNDQNSGGGGGGNGGTGGQGGNAFSSQETTGGRGGAPFPAAVGRLIMGGGGGAGSSNNGAAPAPDIPVRSGTTGGGMIFIRTGTVSGSGTLSADGVDSVCAGRDGAGGGGAGGSVLFFTASGALTNLTVTATGGRGGDANIGVCNVSNNAHGPGGGGAGGIVFASSGLNGGSSVSGAQNGLTTNGTTTIPFGATAGTIGSMATTLTAAQIPGVQACTVATHASLAGLRVRRGLVEFATASQRDTLGFRLYSTADPAGRRGNRALHARPILAPLPDLLDAALYRVPVTAPVGPYVLVEEIETSGRRR
ncbi:MAG TPA: hypothetical protein VFQ51_06000, partial [Vicinamibacteria bacterium]|nr:hypothetical protein [Vicinamibacteria bacterium]